MSESVEATPSLRVIVVASGAEADAIESALVGLDGQVRVGDLEALKRELGTGAAVVLCGSAPPLAEVLSAARSVDPNVPCVAFGDASELDAAFAAGADDFVDAERPSRLRHVVAREARRHRAQADSIAHARLLEQVIDGLPFLLFVKDAATRRLVIANQTFADAFGVTKQWLLGKLDSDYFPPEQAASFVQIDTDVLASKKLHVFEETARTDGVDRIYRTRKLPILDRAGESVHLLGVTEDVTEQRRAEDEAKRSRELTAKTMASYQRRALQMEIIRQQNEDLDRLAAGLAEAKAIEVERGRELEAAVRLRSEFLANFSHEIRTPLNGILGYCDLVLREEGERLTPHGRRDLNVVKQNARTLLALINDILDLSKIEAGRVEIHVDTVDLDELVRECKATVDQALRGKDVELRVRIAPEARSLVTDSLKLRQIVLNLMSNAAKFTDSGEVVVSASASGPDLVLRVEDTGSGIPADQLPFIFEKFRQVDGGSTRRVGGTGLGLAIVREVCNLLGGTVAVESALGRGSLFVVRLPGVLGASAPKQEPTTAVASPAPAGGRTKVLLIDDDPMVAQLVAGHLQREGFEVIFATDGMQGLARARELRPQVIVLDLHMPKLDGWEVLARLKSDPDHLGIPVIILSVDEDRARAFSFGACDYLVKPVEPEHLAAAVRRSASPGAGPVLVVDDDAGTRELVSRSLQQDGFKTIEAGSGQRALELIRQAQPAMVVLDLLMPGMDGFEVIRTLRAERNMIPVLVLTGKELDDAEERALEEGVARVLIKGGVAISDVVREARHLASGAGPAPKPRLLYIEDSAQNRDIMRRILSRYYDLAEAEDGEEGIERAIDLLPDLILMDLSLPRLDGWEATRRLKADARTRRIPVLAVTAHAGDEERQRAKEAGCDAYLTKPVERDVLLATIREHLQRASKP